MQTNAEKLETLLESVQEIEDVYCGALIAEAEAKFDYEHKWAGMHSKASGTIPDKKDEADLECAEEYKAKLNTEALVKGARARLEDVRTAIEARRSLLSAEKNRPY